MSYLYYVLQCTQPLPYFRFLTGDWLEENNAPRDWGPQLPHPEPTKYVQSAAWFTTEAQAYQWMKDHFPAGQGYFKLARLTVKVD